jgi:CheY-like chemotaxis protein
MERELRILLVEDNPDGREALGTLLELLNHQVETAADGVEGIEKALAWPPEVAVIDIGLPRQDGYQVARRLRAVYGRDIFLIAHTGYGNPEDRRLAFQAGFDVHLVKPLELSDLVYWLSVAAARFKGRRQSPVAAG